jgi:hypothetical protein
MKYKLKKIKHKLYSVYIKDRYDLCMVFCRQQEFYESSIKGIKEKPFRFFDFMKQYSKKYGNGVFSYPEDWAGFNIPSKSIEKLYDLKIPDFNYYDEIFQKFYDEIKKETKDFYLIGCSSYEKNRVLDHEIAHGLYNTCIDYKKECEKINKNISNKIKNDIYKLFKKIGYDKHVFDDEIQAYCSVNRDNWFLSHDVLIPKDIYKAYEFNYKEFLSK